MEIKEMNKADLLVKLEEQKHLAQAVEAKDKEIALLQKEHQRLNVKFIELETKVKSQEDLLGLVQKLEDENKKVVAHLNMYVEAFRSTLKGSQGVLDNAIQLEAFINESLRRK
jgi:predicted aconitase